MKGNVNILIEGIVCGDEENRISTRASGSYHMYNDVHILKYIESTLDRDEKADSPDKDSKRANEDCVNMIRISSDLVEMIKTGENSTHMIFDLARPTESEYETPYGSLYFNIRTSRIDIEEKENQIILNMEYSLSNGDSHISDNRINIVVNEAD